MKMRKSLVAALALLAAVASVGTFTAMGEETSGETLNLMFPVEVTTLDTGALNMLPDYVIASAIYEGLYEFDAEDNVVPALAADMPEISEDGLVYTVKLREDAVWSNGTPVTAHDFEYSFKKLTDPANAMLNAWLAQEMLKNAPEISEGTMDLDELGVKAVDDYTLEITIQEPKSYFVTVLAFGPFFPQNQEFVESMGDQYGTSSDTVICNGPYLIENWEQSSLSLDLVKNPDYWDAEKVVADSIHYDIIKDSTTAYNLFEAGQLDAASLSGTIAMQNMNNPCMTIHPTAKISYVRLNQKRKGEATVFANENIRKAFAYGLNKEIIIKNIIADGSVPLYGMIPSGFAKNPETGVDFREEAGDLAGYDLEKAQEYWAAGLEELGTDTITVELMCTDEDRYKKIAEAIQGNLQENLPGLTIEINALPSETAFALSRRTAEYDYDMFLAYWSPDYQDPFSTLNSCGNSMVNNEDPVYDQLLEDASTTYAMDLEKRWSLLIEAEKQFVETDAAVIPICNDVDAVLESDSIGGIQYHMVGATMTLDQAYKN